MWVYLFDFGWNFRRCRDVLLPYFGYLRGCIPHWDSLEGLLRRWLCPCGFRLCCTLMIRLHGDDNDGGDGRICLLRICLRLICLLESFIIKLWDFISMGFYWLCWKILVENGEERINNLVPLRLINYLLIIIWRFNIFFIYSITI